MQRVCLFTDSPEPSGVGEHMLTLAQEFDSDREVTIACPRGEGRDLLLERARTAGFETLALEERRPYGELERALRTSKFDVLHAHAGAAWEGHEGVHSSRRAGTPATIRTEHLPFVLTSGAQLSAYRDLVALLDRLVCVSHAAARTYLEAGVRAELVRVVQNGITAKVSRKRERLGLPDETALVLAVGRLTEQKGHDVLVAAIAKLPGVHAAIVGEGPLEGVLRNRAEELGLEGRVHLLGPRDDVPALLAGADVFALPSRFEGLPLVALEAMAAGLPVVGTRVCGTSEVVVDGRTGRLVAADDADALAAALREALESPKLAAEWGEAGRRRQMSEFQGSRMARETAAVYDEALRSTSTPRKGTRRRQDMNKTRIGFVGAGLIAGRHLGNLLQFPDVSVVAVADPVPERRSSFADRAGAKAYPDHVTMLEGERLDALYVCVPPFGHGEPELRAVEADLPFFVEKPVAADLETAERVAQAVDGQSLITSVGYHWRYLDVYERARELLAENPARLAIGYWLDSTPPPHWWVRHDLSGGQMIEQTSHVFDLARTLVGDVAQVYAATSRVERPSYPDADIADVSTVTLSFASGAVGSISSTCLLGWPHRIGLHLFCEAMAIELAEHEIMVDVGRGRPVTPAQVEPFVLEDRAFIDAVQGKEGAIRAPYADALETHRLACAAARSAESGQPVALIPDLAGV